MTRQYLRPNLQSSMVPRLNSDFSFTRTSLLTTAVALCDAMGLSIATNSPSSLYNFTAGALPIINHIAAPTADIDVAIGGGPAAFAVSLPAPLVDVGTRFTSGGGGFGRCSALAENDGGLGSMAFLTVGYMETIPNGTAGVKVAINKKASVAVTAGGYRLNTTTGNAHGQLLYSDGVTQVTMILSNLFPPGWFSLLSVFDRVAGVIRLITSFESEINASNAGIGSLSSATASFSPTTSPCVGQIVVLQALWFGATAEGIVGANLNSLNQYLNIPVV